MLEGDRQESNRRKESNRRPASSGKKVPRALPLTHKCDNSHIPNLGTLLHFCTHFQQPKKTPKRVHC